MTGRALVADHLDAAGVISTISRLEDRIAARFPERGLRRVAGELRAAAEDVSRTRARAGTRSRVRWLGHILVALVALGSLAVLLATVRDALSVRGTTAFDWVPIIEATIQTLAFAGIAVLFLLALPERIERGPALARLHRLRSLAHVVDMHQLAKDPERLRPDFEPTSASMTDSLDRAAMQHYLEYCSELLSLVGKTAALTVEDNHDPVILETVSDIEVLTTGLSRKIWQKISLLPD